MLYELRRYDVAPTKLPALLERFGGFTVDKCKKHGFRQVGYWSNVIGANDHQLIFLLAWESFEERLQKFDTFLKDPERIRVFADSEKDGPIVQNVTTTLLRPTAFSPMK